MNEILKLPHLCDQYSSFAIEIPQSWKPQHLLGVSGNGNAFIEAPISLAGYLNSLGEFSFSYCIAFCVINYYIVTTKQLILY